MIAKDQQTRKTREPGHAAIWWTAICVAATCASPFVLPHLNLFG